MRKQIINIAFILIFVIGFYGTKVYSNNNIMLIESERENDDINTLITIKNIFNDALEQSDFIEYINKNKKNNEYFSINLGNANNVLLYSNLEKWYPEAKNAVDDRLSEIKEFKSMTANSKLWQNNVMIWFYDDDIKVGIVDKNGEIVNCKYLHDIYIR